MSIQEAAERRRGSERILKNEYPPETSNAGKIIAYLDMLQFHLSKLYDFLDCADLGKSDLDHRSEWLENLVSSYRNINHIVSVIVNSQKRNPEERADSARYLFEISGRLRVNACILSKELLRSFKEQTFDPIYFNAIAEHLSFIVDYDAASSILLNYFLSMYAAPKPDLSVVEIDVSALSKFSKPLTFAFPKKVRTEKKAEGYVRSGNKSSPHPGCLIASELTAANLTVAEAAERLGMTRNQLHRIIRGDSDVSLQTALQLEANSLGPSAREWLILQIDFNLSKHDSGSHSRIGRPLAKQPRTAASLRR